MLVWCFICDQVRLNGVYVTVLVLYICLMYINIPLTFKKM